ncbi:MAG: permease prefix domain 1-containing protein [Clostridiaceae bacterium]|nr:permease prefix domain 1-containing protein [Clostridiaceae bacterium]
MDTIKTYLDNIFAGLPQSEAVLKAKRELQNNMEEKYRAYKAEGLSENEAIGHVITEFGNIDGLIAGLGINQAGDQPKRPLIDREQVGAFLTDNRKAGRLVALGVFLCIAAAAVLILINHLAADGLFGPISGDAAGALGLIPMLMIIAAAVGLFIYSGMLTGRHAWREKEFDLPDDVRADLQRQLEQFMPNFTMAIIVGVALCILSPLPLFLSAILTKFNSEYSVVILLGLIAVAVYLFVRFGTIKDGYNRLLQLEDYTPEKKKEDKVTGTVASIVFPLAAAAYLYMGFVYQLWHPGWVIFPITGILFGIFSAVYEAVAGSKG